MTPIVDGEIRRCSRFRKYEEQIHIMLNSEPRKKKGEARKTFSISIVEDPKKAIVGRSLENELEECISGAHTCSTPN